MLEDNESLVKLVNASGFLFQLKVEEEIRKSNSDWKLLTREHRWLDPVNSKEFFIDLLLEYGISRLVVECKRVRDGNWIFLIGSGKTHMGRAKLLWNDVYLDEDTAWSTSSGWDEFKLTMESPEASFCIVRGQGEKDQPMLERLAGQVHRSSEVLARQEMSLEPGNTFVYIPTIITNAELYICEFDVDNIDLQTGTLPDAEFVSVPMVRFRKSLSTTMPTEERPPRIEHFTGLEERTVIVINSNHLESVLDGIELKRFNGKWPWDWHRRQQQIRIERSRGAGNG